MLITIDAAKCTKCGTCVEECPRYVLASGEDKLPIVKYAEQCCTCGHCVAVCPKGALVHRDMPFQLFTELPEFSVPTEAIENLLLSRRSVRVFKERGVPREDLERLIAAGTNGGTASNGQTEGFIVIQDKKVISDLETLVLEILWRSLKYLRYGAGRTFVKATMGAEMLEQATTYYRTFGNKRRDGGLAGAIFRNAPAVIVTHGLRKSIPLTITNSALATRNMEITALTMGLGTCWAGFLVTAAHRDKEIARFLGLPANRNVYAGLMVGFPKREYKKTIPRKERPLKWM